MLLFVNVNYVDIVVARSMSIIIDFTYMCLLNIVVEWTLKRCVVKRGCSIIQNEMWVRNKCLNEKGMGGGVGSRSFGKTQKKTVFFLRRLGRQMSKIVFGAFGAKCHFVLCAFGVTIKLGLGHSIAKQI